MEAQRADAVSARAAYGLLSKATHVQLEKRAERSSRIQGRHVEPYEVIAQGRFALRFPPQRFASTITGDTALVQVTGDQPTETATVHCAKEGLVWRVTLDLPELMDLPHRPEN
jgi:hypothetical protein